MEKYDQSNTIGMIDESNKYLRAKVQYNRIEGGTWPGNEIDVVYSRYIQFGVQSVEGSILHVEAWICLLVEVRSTEWFVLRTKTLRRLILWGNIRLLMQE